MRVKIYDLRGELVCDKNDFKPLAMGDNRVVWKALNNAGKSLSYGAYFMEVSVEGGGRNAKASRWISVVK